MSDEELVKACAGSQDSEVWEAFFRRFHRLIAGSVYRASLRYGGVPTNLLDDLVQETYAKLYNPERKVLERFVPRHPGAVQGFLRAITINLVHDQLKSYFRARRNDSDDSERDLSLIGGTDTERQTERAILFKEIDLFLRESTHAGRDREIFWYYYRLGMSASEIAGLPRLDLSIKGVESALLRTTRLVRSHFGMPPRTSPKKAALDGGGYKPVESL